MQRLSVSLRGRLFCLPLFSLRKEDSPWFLSEKRKPTVLLHTLSLSPCLAWSVIATSATGRGVKNRRLHETQQTSVKCKKLEHEAYGRGQTIAVRAGTALRVLLPFFPLPLLEPKLAREAKGPSSRRAAHKLAFTTL